MKTIPVITVLFALLPCTQGAESLGWDHLNTHKASEKELRAAPTITVKQTITPHKALQDPDVVRVVLWVENRTGFDIEYHGYGKDRPQIFIKEKRDGKWVASSWDWCGTGIQRHVLKNQQTFPFEIHLRTGPIQVFTVFRNANDPNEFSFIKLYEKDGF